MNVHQFTSVVRTCMAVLRRSNTAAGLVLLAALVPPAPAWATGNPPVIARIETTAHDAQEFFLRATLPVPRDTYLAGDRPPFSVLNPNGSTAPTQVEVVSRFPSRHDGADVIEILALVQRPSGAQVGDPITYEVIDAPHDASPLRVQSDVRELFDTPGSMVLSTHDVYGNEYSADLLTDWRDDTHHLRTLRDGEVARQFGTHEVLLISNTVEPQGVYPHMMGVHAYVTQWTDADYVSLDLRIHNGMSGLDPNDPTDDAMDKLYFQAVELSLPRGWTVLTAFDSPALGAMRDIGSRSLLPIVAPSPDGRMHVLGRQAHLVRRMILTRTPESDAARNLLEERGLGFCKEGPTPNGRGLYSWWNRRTARYFPQNQRLPNLDHIDRWQVRSGMRDQLNHFAIHIAAGTEPGYPVFTPALGYAQPWGIRYGGQTGADEIAFFDGIEIAAFGSQEGYRFTQLTQRLYADRHRSALYDKGGRPTRLVDWVRDNGSGAPYVPMIFFGVPNIEEADPFGFNQAPTFHEDVARNRGLLPTYEDDLLAYHPIDLQHYIRYTRSLKILAWLGNDALAKKELEMAGANARLSFHEYHTSANGNSASGLRGSMTYTAAFPGWGFHFGRASGWLLDTAVAAYALGHDELRSRFLPWFEKVSDVVADGQSTCTGIIQATGTNKIAGGRYRIMQSFEASIIEHMLVGMRSTVFKGIDGPRYASLGRVLERSLYAQMSPLVWRNQYGGGPVDWMAVGPRNPNRPPFCGPPPRPEAQSGGSDGIFVWSDFAYGYTLTRDPVFLRRATELINHPDVIGFLLQAGRQGLASRAPMLALLQELQ